MKRIWLSLSLLALGAGCLAAARLATASPPSRGVFVVGTTGASVQIDPQLSYITTAWWLEYATAAKLYNWSDRGTKLVPEVASRVAVSKRGRTYTFFLRKGFRFSDGSLVTAKSFSYAFDRVANKDLASPGAQFITDPNGTDIVGAAAVSAGLAKHVRGVQVKGPYKLVIRLVKPDQAFVSKLTMPFFQATSSTLPLTREVLHGYPSAGPYFFQGNDVDRLTSIRRNPYYSRGPGRMRPHNLVGLDVQWSLNEEQAFRQVGSQLDEGPVPTAEAEGLVDRYGVNRTRFWSMPMNCIGFLALNNHRPLFRRVAMRQAINWAVDRTALAAQAGPALATPWTHLLPPLLPGSITKKRLQPYSVHPNLAKARRLAGPNLRAQTIRIAYRSSGTIGLAQAQEVRRELIRLGFRAATITMKGFSGGDIYTAMWAKGSDLDLGVSLGLCGDYPDANAFLSFVNPPFGPAGSAKYRAKLARANKLREPTRTRALGKLDLEITNNLAPAAVLRTYNNRFYFSGRVDPRSLAYSGAYQDWSIPALKLK